MARRQIAVSGIVQGVGFRPFVHELATRLGLRGFVRNQNDGVRIEVEGAPELLDDFLTKLTAQPPPLAQIHAVAFVPCQPENEPDFRIEPSEANHPSSIFIGADVASCDACLAELFDPADRRFRYPFLNCTNCGPRLTIIRALPYDRQRTTMAGFRLCRECRAEYENPVNRRFHAEATACPVCGPRLKLLDGLGESRSGAEPLAGAVAGLRDGRIIALKGLGGYHLACDATSDITVAQMRRRKGRDEKPFALMVANVAVAERLCMVTPAERELLASARRPIVLLRRRHDAPVADEVSPGNPFLGVMLPYTPLHHLLLHELQGMPVVMTSGNRSDEPIAFEDADALERLGGIADLFLTHDRPIHLRCDDSVTRVVAGVEMPVRRSRGLAPQPLPLPLPCLRPTLAVGGQWKAAFALGRERHAFLSHHLGDLDHYEAYRAYTEAIDHYERLFTIRPELLVHDAHPDYASTRYAHDRAAREEIETLSVQHHHAHLASCMAEHRLDEPVIGVIFDGTGYGTDGVIWGGEFLIGDYCGFRRAVHLRYVPMPGGDQAIREPWRMAVSYLLEAGRSPDAFVSRSELPAGGVRTIARMIERGFNSPPTSSAGRLFDAVAALIGLRQQVRYEGQAAMELEGIAATVDPDQAYPFDLVETQSCLVIDTRPLIATIAGEAEKGVQPARIGRRFHSTVVEMIAAACRRLRQETGIETVVLSGGVFLNALLTQEVPVRLATDGFRVYRHQRVPPGDGGLCLGQLAIAAAVQESGVRDQESG